MKDVLPEPIDLSELDSVQVGEPLQSEVHDTSPGHVRSSQKPSNVKAFLKRNAFVVLTMGAVVLGQ